MRIGVVIPSFWPAVADGGTVFTSLHTARELAGRGATVFVSSTDANGAGRLDVGTGRWTPMGERLFVKYYRETIVRRLSLSLLFRLWSDVRAADVVHVQGIFSSPTPIALFYAWLLRRPVLLTPHGMLGDWCLANGHRRLKKLWIRALIAPFAQRVTWHATCDQEVGEIEGLFPGARTCLIPNGLDLSEFESPERVDRRGFARRFLGDCAEATDEGEIVVSLGRLHAKKGFDVLIEAFAELRRTRPKALLAIAGPDGGERAALEARIRELGLVGAAHVIDPLSGADKASFLASADLFVLPSHHENFGLVIAEALAAGTPVVASRGTPWEKLEARRCGRWVENRPAEVASAMIDVLTNDPPEMGERGRSWMRESFDWRTIATELERRFDRMLRERR